VELVRAHHPVDLVAVAIWVEVRDRRPEPGDLEHHLRAMVTKERQVLGCLEVMPDVVENRGVDVALVAAEIRLPTARKRVQVDSLRLLLALAAALPWEHGAAEARLVGRRTRFVQAPVPVHQQATSDLGHPVVQKRIHIQLVPEDMSAVGLAVESAGRNPRIDVGCLTRADLQQMAGVQAQEPLHLLVRLHLQVTHPPVLLPSRPMPPELRLEVPAAPRQGASLG
jgi:hypothetical protein